MNTRNPKAKLTVVVKGDVSNGIPSISNTGSSSSIARAPHIIQDLAYIASLGPGPLPWERRTANESPSSIGDGSVDH